MSEVDDQKARLLDFLTDNIVGRERDAVTRAFYEYAEGDAHSHPVGLAILLIACARQMAQLPENVRDTVKELRTMAERVAQMETDLLGKLTKENHATYAAIQQEAAQLLSGLRTELSQSVSTFSHENHRAQLAWNEVVKGLGVVLAESQRIYPRLTTMVESAQTIEDKCTSLQGDLKLHALSDQRILEALESLLAAYQNDRKQVQETSTLLKIWAPQAQANWTSLSYVAGFVLAAFSVYWPWWGMWTAFAAGIILLQGISRRGKKAAVKL
jgi:hypothetical protein